MKTNTMPAKLWAALLLVVASLPAFAQDSSFTAAYVSNYPFPGLPTTTAI